MTTPRHDKERDREIHEMLRAPMERLAAPQGSWEQVFRRARRRRWAKAGLAVAAVVVVVAGAIPAVIGVRDHSSDEQIQVAAAGKSPAVTPGIVTRHRSSAPAPVTTAASPETAAPSISPVATVPPVAYGGTLAGFDPVSVSFVSQSVGFAWGTVGRSRQGVVAETLNQGATWFRLTGAPDSKVDVTNDGNGERQIRFVSGTVGYIYGSSLYVTSDAGQSWQMLPSHGYVEDIEAGAQQAWALVRTRGLPSSGTLQLFHSTPAAPALAPVSAVSPMTAVNSVASLAVNTNVVKGIEVPSVDVLVGSSAFWESANGKAWHHYASPCHRYVQTALVTAAAENSSSVVAACGFNGSAGAQDKQVWATTTSGKHWRETPRSPSSVGYLASLSAGAHNDLILGESRGNAQITDNGGKSWRPTAASAGVGSPVSLSFVGFINPDTIVALADPGSSPVGGFAVSSDIGRTWHLTPFPK